MRTRLSLLTLGFLFASSAAQAVTRPEAAPGIEVDRRGEFSAPGRPSNASPLVRNEAWGQFLRQNPGWIARWEAAQGGPARFDGPPIAIRGWSGDWLDASHAKDAALEFLRTGEQWIPVDELEHVRTVQDDGGFWVHFTQRHDGVPVWGSRVTVRLTAGGRAVSVTNRAFPNLALDVAPRAARGGAEIAASLGLPSGTVQAGESSLYILPIRHESGPEFRLVWKSDWKQEAQGGHWSSFVDARDGSLLWRFDTNHYGEVSGHVTTAIEPVTADGTFETRALPYATIEVMNGDNTTTPDATDLEGNYSVTTPGTTGRSLKSVMAGGFGVALDMAQGGSIPQISGPLADGANVTGNLDWISGTSDPAGRDVYYHAMTAHDHIRLTEPGFTALDYTMPLRFNLDQTCNAFWDGEGVNFFRAGGRCVNTGRIADVIYHEYGHGITDLQYRPFYPNGAMHEGWSDYYAATITNQPLIGIGFVGPGTILRRIDEDRVWPDDIVEDDHITGLIVAGALWDLREIVGAARADSLWHFARYGYADNFDDYFADLLLYDSGDGNIYDGTPNFQAITSSFRKHGIGDYSIHVSHQPFKDTENTTAGYAFIASFLSVFPLTEGSATLHLSITRGEDVQTFDYPMSPTGEVREYTKVIDPLESGTGVAYYFTAADTTGATVSWPEGGADDPFRFQIGPDSTPPSVQHELIQDLPVSTPNVRVRASVNDNLDQAVTDVSVIWRKNGAELTTTAMAAIGGDLYEGMIPIGGGTLGDAFDYRIEASDASTAHNQTVVPSTGFYTFLLVRGLFADFEADNGAMTGEGEWEWGAPSAPISPYSGANVWGTNLDGLYSNSTMSILTLPTLDLSAYQRAGLIFRHAMMCEPSYDGGVVEVSTDGVTWNVLRPDGDYDDSTIDALGRPGFTGGDGTWRLAEFDLGSYVGQSGVQVRLRFGSDQGVVGPGWYIDDLQVVERQIYLRPLNLRTENSDGAGVLVAWDSPENLAAKKNAAVTGFNVYRANDPDGTPQRLNPTPVVGTNYLDESAEAGRTYSYWASAVYTDGESALVGPVDGQSFIPTFALEIESLTASVDSIGAQVDTSLVVKNIGSGSVEANVYVAASTQTIDDLRIALDLTQSDGEWHTLFTEDDSTDVMDLLSIEARQTETTVRFRLTTRESFPALDSMNVLITFDTDRDPDTGAEFSLVGGAIPRLFFGTTVVLLTGEQDVVLDEPIDAVLNEGGTTAEVELHKQALGGPRRLNVGAAALVAQGNRVYDRMPNSRVVRWVTPTAAHLSVSSETPINLGLVFDSGLLTYGRYEGKLLFDTNDPEHEVVALPLVFNVNRVTPTLLEAWDANANAEGVILTWRTGSTDAVGFDLYRREVAPSSTDEVKLNGAPLSNRVGGDYQFVDITAEAGREYEYRLVGIESDGSLSALGSYRVSTEGLVPTALWLSHAVPNPARGASIVRFGLPVDGPVVLKVYRADGRLVRTLLNGTPFKAGYHSLQWDGRDDERRPTAAGLYFFRLERDGRVKTEKLLRIK